MTGRSVSQKLGGINSLEISHFMTCSHMILFPSHTLVQITQLIACSDIWGGVFKRCEVKWGFFLHLCSVTNKNTRREIVARSLLCFVSLMRTKKWEWSCVRNPAHPLAVCSKKQKSKTSNIEKKGLCVFERFQEKWGERKNNLEGRWFLSLIC